MLYCTHINYNTKIASLEKKIFLKIKAENFGKLFDCLVEILKKILCMSKYKEIMYVSSTHFDYVYISCTHDLPRFPCY
jgi:hypothetical protein